NGKVFAKFGDVTDTKPRKVMFQVRVLPGQAGKDIRNVAVVDSDNITTPSTPEEVVEVYPRETALESTKTAELFEKAAGNTDAAHPEIGDTLLYTIQTRNTASDSRVTNLKITDEIPTGLEYVPGTLKVNDVQVTDDQDGDKGHFANGKIFAGFGDVTDTEWHKVTFQVKVLPGQAGKDIINIAAVEGDNVGTPDRPRNEVEVYPRNPQIETDKSVANTVSKATYEVGDTITYTIRVRGVVNDTYLENLTITDTLPAGLEYVPGSLKVDGVTVTDPKDDDAGHSVTGDVYGSFGNVDDTEWHTLEFQAIILPGQGGLVIENTARVTGDNIDQPGEPTEKMVVEPEPPVESPTDPPVNPPVDPDPPVTPPVTPPAPVLESRKTSRDLSGGIIGVGDTLEYTISARNTVAGSYVLNLVIADILPEGLTYVAGSLRVDGVSVTDNVDGDKGQYVNGKVSGNFGRITDTEWHTITFKATVKATQAGKSIVNIGEVTGDNVTTPEKPSNVIEVTDSWNNDGNTTNPGGSGDSDGDSNEDPNGNSNEATDGDSNGNPDEDSNGDADGGSNTGAQTPDDHDDSTLGVSDSTPRDPAESGDQITNEPNGNKLPNTATNMYSFMLAGAIMLFAGLLLLRRKKV
ncbi:isopeptide-forming domain-containing fimbrial protein, partial [Paenibacillus sp. MDMC362]|uniref:isopeptide-forming domain-containing fimbrial protein n=1 Tax=Paenibacillus sp. MDMC362 TaxID=2977365 RepID=UPI000DC2192C